MGVLRIALALVGSCREFAETRRRRTGVGLLILARLFHDSGSSASLLEVFSTPSGTEDAIELPN